MPNHFITYASEAAPFAVIGLIGFFLWKTGRLRVRTVTKIRYVYKQSFEHLRISYKRFHGVDEYSFYFSKGGTVTLAYEVKVEEGELHLEWQDRTSPIWSRTFTKDEEGTIVFTAEHRLHSLIVEGNQTKGGCRIDFTHQREKAGTL
ncbi:hypothetical protein RG959_06445 [Domibacillus sp. 8LH]|uniref:hypothetical protein n=1 Tax=Domibacillus sp. 8LH TaxID=3073900 RepID=UPI00317CA071